MSLLKMKWNGSERLVKLNLNTVTIGGHSYPTVKIGNLIFTALSYNVPTTNSKLPESGIADLGLLYPAYDIFNEIEPILPDGWRIPKHDDFVYLKNNISSYSNDYISQNKGGTNTTGFNAGLLGYLNKDGKYVYKDAHSLYWSSTGFNTQTTYNLAMTKDGEIDRDDYSRGTSSYLAPTSLEVRFCSDV